VLKHFMLSVCAVLFFGADTVRAGLTGGGSPCCVRWSVQAKEESHLDRNSEAPHR
jgi:hypothetical protein